MGFFFKGKVKHEATWYTKKNIPSFVSLKTYSSLSQDDKKQALVNYVKHSFHRKAPSAASSRRSSRSRSPTGRSSTRTRSHSRRSSRPSNSRAPARARRTFGYCEACGGFEVEMHRFTTDGSCPKAGRRRLVT